MRPATSCGRSPATARAVPLPRLRQHGDGRPRLGGRRHRPAANLGLRGLADLAVHPHLLADRLPQPHRRASRSGPGPTSRSSAASDSSREAGSRRAEHGPKTGKMAFGSSRTCEPPSWSLADLGRCRPHAVSRARAGGERRRRRSGRTQGHPLPQLVTEHPRIGRPSPDRGSVALPGQLAIGSSTAACATLRRPAASFRLWRAHADSEARSGARAESAGVSDAPGDLVHVAAARRALRHRLAQPRIHAAARCGSGRWHPAVRIARWFERPRTPGDAHLCVSRGMARFLQSRFGMHAMCACSTTGRPRRSCRWTAPSASDSGRRCSGGWASAERRRRVHRLSLELDRRRRLRRRHRGGAAARRADSRLGGRPAERPAVPRT